MKKFIGVCMTAVLFVGLIFGVCPAEAEELEATIIEEVEAVPVIFEQLTEKEKAEERETIVTICKDQESANYIWEKLSIHSPNDVITAGIMGYFWRESNFRSDAVAGWHTRNVGRDSDICVEFTSEVDGGLHDGSSREYFIEKVSLNYGGYGLGQWLSLHYLEHFYDFIRERGGSIGDAELQCEFIFESMKQNEKLWEMLLECETAEQAGRRIAVWYDGASSIGVEYIASAAHMFYKEYCQ